MLSGWLTLSLLLTVQNAAYALRNITVNLNASDISTSCAPSSGWVEECVLTASWQFTGVALHYIVSPQDSEFQPATITIDDTSFVTRFDDFVQLPSTASGPPSLVWSVTGLHNHEHKVLITKDGGHLAEDTFIFTTTDQENPTTTTQSSTPPVLVSNNLQRRAAKPACIKNTTEGSCLNLAANCIDSAKAKSPNAIWSIRSCAVAATCYGVADLINSTNCQTGLNISVSDQLPLNLTIYRNLVGDCKNVTINCTATLDDFSSWFYSTLKDINTSIWPSSIGVVNATWAGIVTWSATPNNITYAKLDSWYHTPCPFCQQQPTTSPATHYKLSRGARIGIIIGSIVVACYVLALAIRAIRGRRRPPEPHPPAPPQTPGPDDQPPPSPTYRPYSFVDDEHPSVSESNPLM